ncbi:MAG TPA: AraC family transcriptional regulator [Allosphingosinicella sp.]
MSGPSERLESVSEPGIQEEPAWRSLPSRLHDSKRLVVGRWRGGGDAIEEHEWSGDPDRFTIGFPLRQTQGALYVGQRLAMRGRALPGWVQITPPVQGARIEQLGRYDQLHLFVPRRLLIDCYEEAYDRSAPPGIELFSRGPAYDAALERLGTALLSAPDIGADVARIYADGLCGAILARLLDVYSNGRRRGQDEAAGLIKWRLTRTYEFVHAHLAETVRLEDLAAAAGLSRMHFAAQFRAATGLRPHEYLLRSRVERAQDLLRRSGMPLAEVALSVGFQTQAHFTTVFRRFTGLTPNDGASRITDAPDVWAHCVRSPAPASLVNSWRSSRADAGVGI